MALAAPAAAFGALANHDPADCAVPLSAADVTSLVAPPIAPSPTGGEMPLIDTCGDAIRPGILMTAPYGCTMNWIFRDNHDALYIGTAGHCLGGTGSTGRSVSVAVFGHIGESVYTLNAGVGEDFGLVKIKPELHDRVSATLCKWGGPHAMAEGADYPGRKVLLQYGHGTLYGALAPTKGRAFVGSGAGDSVSMQGLSAGGDSGSPIMSSTGEAFGVLTHGVGIPPFNIGAGLTYGSRLDMSVALAEAALGVDLELVTSDVPVQVGMGVPFPTL